jgi:two-component system, sensor histidine kinase and response regulator
LVHAYGPTLIGFYEYRPVALAAFIAVIAAYAALNLAAWMTTGRGNTRLAYQCGSATAMGIGIWAAHYIGMGSFHLPVPAMFDWLTVLPSLFAAILASGMALFAVCQPTTGWLRIVVGSIFMGSGIAAINYLGMEAMRLRAMCVYL